MRHRPRTRARGPGAALSRFVYFDAAGTLIRPRPSVGAIYSRAGEPFGLNVAPTELEAAFRAAWRAYVRPEAGGPMSALADEETTKAWWRGLVYEVLREVAFTGDKEAVFAACYRAFASTDAWHIFEDVAPTIEALSRRGVPMGVLSNWDARLPPLLADLKLAPYFRAMVVSAEVGVEKPDPRIFELACERAGVPPSEVLYVGDLLHLDVVPARALGIKAYLIDREGTSGSPLAIRSLLELLDL